MKALIVASSLLVSSFSCYSWGTLNLTDFARNSEGHIQRMENNEAREYCASKHGHLPTAREMVTFAVQHHAKSFPFPEKYACPDYPAAPKKVALTMNEVHNIQTHSCPEHYCEAIISMGPFGTDGCIHAVYDQHGYVSPLPHDEQTEIWTLDAKSVATLSYIFDLQNGFFIAYPPRLPKALKCVLDK